MKKNWICLATFGLSVLMANAQNENDALRYSMTTFGGTSRYTAMGGAFGALGGDLSALSSNPAGIGLYRKTEFNFSLGFDQVRTGSDYFDTQTSTYEPNLNLPGIGIVGASDGKDGSRWRKVQFAIAYNRLNTFHNDYTIEGRNTKNSVLDAFTYQAYGFDVYDLNTQYPFDAGLAYNTWLIDTIGNGSDGYWHQMYQGDIRQVKNIHTKGRAGETVVSVGGNFDDRIYVGGSLGFPGVRYTEESLYTETATDTTIEVDKFEFTEVLQTRGSGFNIKFGSIFRPWDFMRIGVALHTPTWYALTNTRNTSMHAFFREGSGYQSEYSDSSPEGNFDYRITAPGRAIGSIAFIIGRVGLISADYEYIDYSNAFLRAASDASFTENEYDFAAENRQVELQFRDASNLRVGTEWRYGPLSLRGGYALYGNPYTKEAVINNAMRTSYTGGLGFRRKGYSIDFAYARTQWASDYYLYDPSIAYHADIDNVVNRFTVTLSFRY